MKKEFISLFSTTVLTGLLIVGYTLYSNSNRYLVTGNSQVLSETVDSPSIFYPEDQTANWISYIDGNLDLSFKHPSDVEVTKTEIEGLVIDSVKGLKVEINRFTIPRLKNLNTQAEMDIDNKIASHKNGFTLINSIEPINIGYSTGITYTVQESDFEMTYFYLPQKDNNYLLISSRNSLNDIYGIKETALKIIDTLELH